MCEPINPLLLVSSCLIRSQFFSGEAEEKKFPPVVFSFQLEKKRKEKKKKFCSGQTKKKKRKDSFSDGVQKIKLEQLETHEYSLNPDSETRLSVSLCLSPVLGVPEDVTGVCCLLQPDPRLLQLAHGALTARCYRRGRIQIQSRDWI